MAQAIAFVLISIFFYWANLYTGHVPNFGSNWNNGTNAGTFQLNVNNSPSRVNANITTHLLNYVNLFYFYFAYCRVFPDDR